MAWLYLPVSVGLNSVSNNCFLNQELSVSWRGKYMPAQSLSRKWKKDKFMKLLYGMILQPLMAQSLVEKWISSLPDFHVNHGQMLENYRKPKTSVGYGMTSKESFAKLDPNFSSWKTSQVSLMGELTPFLGRWPQSGSMLNGVVSKSPKLAETITEKEFLFSDIYPTPTLTDSKNVPYQISNGKKYPTLTGKIQIFPTPTASQITTEGTTRLYRNLFLNGVLTLEEATVMNGNYNPLNKKGALEMFPTPNMADGMRTSLTHQGGNLTLLGHVKIWPTPQASEGEKYRLQGNSQGSKCLMALHGGKLNPQFVEWLMGWPIGWTDLEHVEMESSLIKRIEHLLNSSPEQSKGGI